jgi:hypothetical protein
MRIVWPIRAGRHARPWGGGRFCRPAVSDFVATIYHALGYGRDTQVLDMLGRSHFIVAGKPVIQLF